MTEQRVDTRPLRSAAQQQTALILKGTFGSGAGGGAGLAYLASLSSFDLPVSRVDLLIALAISVIGAAGPAAYTALTALARTVRQGEKDTTPWRDARNDRGEPLRPPDVDLLREAVQETAWSWGYDGPVERPGAAQGPSGTSAYPDVGQARSMRGDHPAATYHPADGPPSKQLHRPDPDGAAARAPDGGWRERGSDPRVRRGRDVADRNDRRAAHARDSIRDSARDMTRRG